LKNDTRMFIDIIKSGLTDEKITLSSCELNYDMLLKNSVKHHIIVMFYYGLYNCGLNIGDLKEKTFSLVMSEINIDMRQQHYIEEIRKLFSDNNVDFMLLKGSVMKRLYKKSELRRMGDIDILIKNEQYPNICELMKQAGYKPCGETDHELNWTKAGILIELHKRLIPSYNKDFYSYYGDGWKLAKHKTANEYVLKPEDMFIYLFTHFAKHYRDAGIGITHMCDLWVYMSSYKLDYSYIKKELQKLHLFEFFKNINDTLLVWFENKDDTEMTDYITNVILNSGVYGTHDNHVLSAALKNKKKYNNTKVEKLVKIFKSFFLPFSVMRNRHLILVKYPFLLPFFWIVRWFDLAFRKKDRIINKINDFSMINDTNISDYHLQLEYVGLDYNF